MTDVTRIPDPIVGVPKPVIPPAPAPIGVTAPAKPDCTGLCACGVEPLAHPKYSFGMLLEPGSLTLEHRYHALRANTHNIRLHDFGTVCGLRVDKHPSAQCVNTYAILRPGLALDCCGREIVVPEDLFVPLQDGATSGWCGAAMGSIAATSSSGTSTGAGGTNPPAVPAKLYICLRYAQCDTDPIPTYVRACGCCSSCEHGDCTPSVTREGYEVVVTSTQPPDRENPIGKAFCDWLQAQLAGPGQGSPGKSLYGRSIGDVVCKIITEPCADVCSGGNDLLLLATASFAADGTLSGIDNVTGRRLVIPTGAIADAIGCLATAQIACCAQTDAYLSLAASVNPDTVDVSSTPDSDVLTYAMTVTNSDAEKNAGSFELELAFEAGKLTFGSAALTVAGEAQPAPAGSAAGVTVSIPNLAAAATAELVVTASFDPTKEDSGSTLACVASIDEYAGGHDPDVTLTTSFI